MNKKILLKTFNAMFIAFVFQFVLCTFVFAKNNVSDILIDVLVHDNGSATITQQWTGNFNTGTENYLPISDDELFVSNFSVTMNGKQFEYVQNWNVNGNFDNKKYKCGINKTTDGIELCYGISEYGNNVYTFKYDINPLFKSYIDYDGFNFMFLNPDMSIYPSKLNLRLRMENGTLLDTNVAKIWGFRFDGDVWFRDGYAVAYTNSSLVGNNAVVILIQLNKGIIHPSVSIASEFSSVLDVAFENSSYAETLNENKQKKTIDWFLIGIIIAVVSLILTPIIIMIYKIVRWLSLKKFYKNINYFRDIPNDGNISITHILHTDFGIWRNKESDIIGALIMKMINDKNLEPVQEKSYGFFGNEKISTSMKIVSEPNDDIVKELFDIIKLAAGVDGILQEKEMKKYATKNYEVLNGFLTKIKSKGHNELNIKKGYKKVLGKNLKDLSVVGKNELEQVFGLRKFLDEFTMIDEREIQDVIIWENLLIYATLFGLAKKVLANLKKVYPEKITEIDNYSRTVYISNIYYRSLYLNSMNARRAVDAARMARMAASGLGGHTSLGGGGGFSGGGSGGGSR